MNLVHHLLPLVHYATDPFLEAFLLPQELLDCGKLVPLMQAEESAFGANSAFILGANDIQGLLMKQT